MKILDFGIAKLQVDQKQTATGTVLGTPLYMPPEQWEGRADVDGRVDIYALGMILYEALTGTYPFEAKSAMQLMYAHTTKEVPDPGQRVALPERLRQLVLAMVKKRPEDRPASMAVVEAELVQVLAELGDPARPGHPEDPPALLHPVAAGAPQPMAATGDPVLSFTAQPSLTGAGLLADSWGAGAAARPPAEDSPKPAAAAAGPPPAIGRSVRSRRLLPVALAGGAILALGATAVVGLTLSRPTARSKSAATLAPGAGASPTAARSAAATRLVELGPGRLWVERPAMTSATDGPAYAVEVARFAIEAYEVSAAQLAEYSQATQPPAPLAATAMATTAATAAAGGSLPAVGLSRDQAMRYCAWRHRGGRLPSEAEWEYAARDGRSDHLYPWSGTTADGSGPVGSRANLGSWRAQLEPVDSHPTGATAQGVYNLLGNAAEWTLSDATAYPGSRAVVPPGLAVVRGGSAITPVHGLLATTRQFVPATRSDPFIGFRCAVSLR